MRESWGPSARDRARSLPAVGLRGLRDRRDFIVVAAGGGFVIGGRSEPLRPIVISVRAMLDEGAHSGQGLGEAERSAFKYFQQEACRQYATSGIRFDVRLVDGAYLRMQGYSEIPPKFLMRGAINLFVTDTLGYDIDRDRTGGCSIGPRPPSPKSGGDPFYKTFLGLREARENTLLHEYAHHFCLDTRRNPTTVGNLWADLRNDFLLWRQRHGVPILSFRACVDSEWAKLEAASPAKPVEPSNCFNASAWAEAR